MKTFTLGDILSITTGRLLSESGMDGVYKILNYMTGDNLFTHQLPRACDDCRPLLEKKYPHLSENNFKSEIKDLDDRLSKKHSVPETVIKNWLNGLIQFYGNSFEVPTLKNYKHIDPIDEIHSTMPSKKILTVNV